MSPSKRGVITGPDIDKLASGIYAPAVQELREKLARQENTNRILKRENKDLRKKARAATNAAAALRKDLATSRETRGKFIRENTALKLALLNAGIPIPKPANGRIELYHPDGTPKTVDEIRAEAAAMRGEE